MHPSKPGRTGKVIPDLVLAVSFSTADMRALTNLFAPMPWRLAYAARLPEARRKATSHRVRIVLCERDLPGGDWKALLEYARDLPHAPRFILTSPVADERLWAEVLNLGGYDVLLTPFDADEVRRVISCAMESRYVLQAGRGIA